MARPVVEHQLQLHHDEQAEEHGEPARLGDEGHPDRRADREDEARVERDPAGLTRKEPLEHVGDDVAAVEGQHREEVEQPDRRPGPPDGLCCRGALPAVLVERVDPHHGEQGQPGRDVGDRSGEGDEGLGPERQGLRRDVRGVAGHEVERDLGPGAGPAGGHGVPQFVQQREAGHRHRQPDAELVAVDEHEQHDEQQEPGPYVEREAQHAERAVDGRGHSAPMVRDVPRPGDAREAFP